MYRHRLISIFVALVCATFTVTSLSDDRQVVAVGGYLFPPFVERDENDVISGVTIDLIDAMNEVQGNYYFLFRYSSPKGRYKLFEQERIDMLFFESKEWGWKDYPIDSTRVFLRGAELYIAKNKPGRDQNYFNNFRNKRIVGILGYHYGFADFNSDEAFLRNNYNIVLITNNESSIELIRGGRSDVAVVTKSYLQRYLKQNPKAVEDLLLSENLDQLYNHTILVRHGINANVDEMNQLLRMLAEKGKLAQIWEKYGINTNAKE